MKKTISCFIFAVFAFSGFTQAVLVPEVLQKVSAAVFEVVVLKPQTDSLEYEKPLPFDRLPYMERTDKYRSIGTAFLLKDGFFYSAAHVFQLLNDSQLNDYYIRDGEGAVYPLDTFVKFSTARDFVVFTVKNFTVPEGAGLETQENASLNSSVFTVGNALGEGIVIRNGMLTSQTFETENGEWKWLRFSAAASPGNSGGPLITEKGNVVGIVTMKNQNENLNYALPISELANVENNKGVVHQRVLYSFPNILSDRKFGEFDYTMDLPLPYDKVRAEVSKKYHQFTSELAGSFKKEFDFNGEKSFTTAGGFAEIMFDNYIPSFPYIMINEEDKKWTMRYPGDNNLKESKLGQNGFVRYGGMFGYTMAYITKPDNMNLSDLIFSPKTYIDFILKAATLYRIMGGERIAVTSFGEPLKTERHTDAFGRTWFASYWKLEFADYMAVTYALPVPGGLFVMMNTDSTETILNGVNIDLDFMSDYVYPRYVASIKDWNEFFALEGTGYSLYAPFSDISFVCDEKTTEWKSPEWTFTLPQDLMSVNEKTYLAVSLGYAQEEQKVYQEIRSIDFYYRPVTEEYMSASIVKYRKPPEGENRNLTDHWEKAVNRRYPYNAKAFDQDEYTYYDEVIRSYPDGADETNSDTLFVISLELHGKDNEEAMRTFASSVKKNVLFSEPSPR